eukprot:Em0379g1a
MLLPAATLPVNAEQFQGLLGAMEADSGPRPIERLPVSDYVYWRESALYQSRTGMVPSVAAAGLIGTSPGRPADRIRPLTVTVTARNGRHQSFPVTATANR